MASLSLSINGRSVRATPGATILEAAGSVGVYIPTLCFHPDLPPRRTTVAAPWVYQAGEKIANSRPGGAAPPCGLCLVEVKGWKGLVPSCTTAVEEGMAVVTEGEHIAALRQHNLVPILARHPHACLTCAQQEGCSLTQCSSGVPEEERCCVLFGRCELQKVVRYLGVPSTVPRWTPTHLPVDREDPLLERHPDLCIGCIRCVRACAEAGAGGVIGFVFDAAGRIRVGKLAPTLGESGCTRCAACVEVCPTGALGQTGTTRSRVPGGVGSLRGRNLSPQEKPLAFHAENVNSLPEAEGVFRLFDGDGSVLLIKGTANLREEMLSLLRAGPRAVFFDYREDKMYSLRESEMLQAHIREYGAMPGGVDEDLDDLY